MAGGATTAGTRLAYQQTLGVGRVSGKGFQYPVDVAVDPDGLICVLNRSSSWHDRTARVVVTSLDEATFAEFGRFGTDRGELFMPTALVIDQRGRRYVADEHLHAVTVFAPDGSYLARWGKPGVGPGRLDRPSGLAFDADGNLWVSDQAGVPVQRFTPDGEYLSSFGSPGSGPGQLSHPWGLTVGPEGHVWVADWRNDRVVRFTPDGRHLASYGEGVLSRPAGVAVAADGGVHVTDWANDCLREFDDGGTLRDTVFGEATLSRWAEDYLQMFEVVQQRRVKAGRIEEERWFRQPSGVAFSTDGLLLVADTGRHRIQVYRDHGAAGSSGTGA